MRFALILLIFFVILCTGYADDEPPKKDVVEKPVADESVTKLEIEMPIYTSLLEMSRDARHGNADKWKNRWIIFEGIVKNKEEGMLILHRPSSEVCAVIDNTSKPQLYKYEQGRYYIFSAKVIDLSLRSDFVGATLRLEDKGKLVIPPDYKDPIDIDLNVLANDVKQGGHEKWIGKRVRFIGKVDYKPEEGDELHIVNPDFDIFNIFDSFTDDKFEFIISGFDPNSNELGKYKHSEVYTFTVKIESFSDGSLDPVILFLTGGSLKPRLIASIVDE